MSEPNNNLEDTNSVPEDANSIPEEESVPKKDLKFSYFEPVAGIVFAVIAAVVFLGFPILMSVIYIGGPIIPTFIAEYFPEWDLLVIIPGIIWTLLRIGTEVFYLVERRYTKRLAKITVIANVLAAICTFIIFISPRILNPDYVDWVHSYFANVSVWFGNILAKPNLIILVIIMVALILDSITVIRKGNKAEGKENEEDDDDEEPVEEGAV